MKMKNNINFQKNHNNNLQNITNNLEEKVLEFSSLCTVCNEIIPQNQLFEGIHDHNTVLYDNKLWLFGGACHDWAK